MSQDSVPITMSGFDASIMFRNSAFFPGMDLQLTMMHLRLFFPTGFDLIVGWGGLGELEAWGGPGLSSDEVLLLWDDERLTVCSKIDEEKFGRPQVSHSHSKSSGSLCKHEYIVLPMSIHFA